MDAPTQTLETSRLTLREAALSDSSFVRALLNDPSWLENIGDRGVRSDADAAHYIQNNIWLPRQTNGFGMYVVELKSPTLPIGMCGLLKRDFLSAPDLGFALLPDYVGQGYAAEAAHAIALHAKEKLGIARLYAMVKRDNRRSVKLLGRLGFNLQGPYVTPQGEEIDLYAMAEALESR
jgi:[ribosomal protein S5]-alanine N-acetyltransferase